MEKVKGQSKHINKTLRHRPQCGDARGREAGEAGRGKGVKGDGGRLGLGWWTHRWGRNQEASCVRNRMKRVLLGARLLSLRVSGTQRAQPPACNTLPAAACEMTENALRLGGLLWTEPVSWPL